jgi:hypothetical protein
MWTVLPTSQGYINPKQLRSYRFNLHEAEQLKERRARIHETPRRERTRNSHTVDRDVTDGFACGLCFRLAKGISRNELSVGLRSYRFNLHEAEQLKERRARIHETPRRERTLNPMVEI